MSVFKQKPIRLSLILLVSLSFCLAACQPGTATDTPEAEDTQPDTTEEPMTEEAQATASEATEMPTGEIDVGTLPDDTGAEALPADPIPQTFLASDGTELQGTFYPADSTDAPLIVLMHWAPGDQADWQVIAPWLQNRGVQPEVNANGHPWLDAGWFPEINPGNSFNVFTFTFRDCEGGCQSFDREGWLLDVEAAMIHIIGIENVDLSRVLTIGASIGADGAAYGCHFYNSELGGCQGALSLSPGGYLTVPYPQEVADLEAEVIPRPAWCLYSAGDAESAAACQDVTGQLYQATEYEGTAHGMDLIDPERTPNPLDKILEFIELYLHCDVCSI